MSAKVFCLCRKPQGSRHMVGCDGCSEWFHYDCLGLTAKQVSLFPTPWFCPSCSVKETERLIQSKVADEVAKVSKLIRDETFNELKEIMNNEIKLHVGNMKSDNNFVADQKTIQELKKRVKELEEQNHDQIVPYKTKLAEIERTCREFEDQNKILRDQIAQNEEEQKKIKELRDEEIKGKYAELNKSYEELERQNKIFKEDLSMQKVEHQNKIEELELIVAQTKQKYADLNKSYQELKKRNRGKLSLSNRNSQ